MSAPLEPLDGLDAAFTLPDNIDDADLRELYDVLVVRMRREAEGLAMNTVQILLIERIAYNYVVMRHRERRPTTGPGATANTRDHKDFNTFWLSMTQEFNRQLNVAKTDIRKQVINEFMTKVGSSLARVLSEPQRVAVVSRLKLELDA